MSTVDDTEPEASRYRGASEDESGPARAQTDDGALGAGSTATGAGTSSGTDHGPGDEEYESSLENPDDVDANPEALIEGNRVATKEDME
jgi:hypothetical protein